MTEEQLFRYNNDMEYRHEYQRRVMNRILFKKGCITTTIKAGKNTQRGY